MPVVTTWPEKRVIEQVIGKLFAAAGQFPVCEVHGLDPDFDPLNDARRIVAERPQVNVGAWQAAQQYEGTASGVRQVAHQNANCQGRRRVGGMNGGKGGARLGLIFGRWRLMVHQRVLLGQKQA